MRYGAVVGNFLGARGVLSFDDRLDFSKVAVDHKPMASSATAPIDRLFTFSGCHTGPWLVDRVHCVVGEAMAVASWVSFVATPVIQMPSDASWLLRGIRSNERYVSREEKSALVSKQESLGRAASTKAALIPIRKNAAWWALSQDQRRHIFEAQSHHIEVGLKYLPAVARRLYQCRDLGPEEPFDFLTWFE